MANLKEMKKELLFKTVSPSINVRREG